jgi:glutamate N-acetyltransferase / amino-acid N-acetyltransferase
MTRQNEGWKEIEGGVTTPLEYEAAALSVGIKPGSQKKDLAILYSKSPAWGAALFTQNRVPAAPVIISRRLLQEGRGRLRALIVNSGNANACTGKRGLHDAERMTRLTADALKVPVRSVLVASTGVIGLPLPMGRIAHAIARVAEQISNRGGLDFSEAILTTDTRRKGCVVQSRWGGRVVTIAGAAKGAGMIQPRLATMLAFLTTDAQLPVLLLKKALRRAAEVSFNRLTVDGDTSTNDSLFLLANGASGAPAISQESRSFDHFLSGLTQVCTSLAQQIARDGEGAAKFIAVRVSGGRTSHECERVARCIANSSLVKTAMAGADANWGRIICAAGYSGVPLSPERVDISLNGLQVCRRGQPTGFDERRAKRILQERDIQIDVHLGRGGRDSATVWTCDLTEDYIKINALYRT